MKYLDQLVVAYFAALTEESCSSLADARAALSAAQTADERGHALAEVARNLARKPSTCVYSSPARVPKDRGVPTGYESSAKRRVDSGPQSSE